jgi:pimeloyl-ACP methyl ester carboxylesterase
MTIPGTRRAALRAIRSEPKHPTGVERRIRVPPLIVWGSEDCLIPASDAPRVRARIALTQGICRSASSLSRSPALWRISSACSGVLIDGGRP